MKFNSSMLPSTHIPGTMSGNMSPQVLPSSAPMANKLKAAISDSAKSRANTLGPNSKPNSNTWSGRNSGNRKGGRTGIKRDNKYTSIRTPKLGGNVNINIKSSGSNELDTGRWGYNSQDSTPVTVESSKIGMYTNPMLPGEFDPVYTDLSLTTLAVNCVDIDPIGYSRTNGKMSVALANFHLIYSKMVSRLANNPSKAYQIAFQNILNVKIYFGTLFDLLIRYYEMESILAWNPPDPEFNITLEAMRKIFDRTEILQLKIDLVELLQLYYIPNEFVNLANYFNQTFKTGEVSTSKVFKFMSSDLAIAIRDNSTAAYITLVRNTIAKIRNTTDVPADGLLSAYTMAQISGFLEKDFTFGQKYSSGLPAAANRAIHDINAYDIFINQSVRYSNKVGDTITDYRFPDYPANANTPYVSHKEGDSISTFQIAFQGCSSTADELDKTGFIAENTIAINDINGQPRRVNKLWIAVNPNGTMKVFTRSTVKTNIFNDLNFVDLNSTFPFTKVSIPPSHAQLLYANGDPLKDVATRDFSNKIFGNL